MDIKIELASPADAKEILDYLKQIGKESDNLTFGSEGLPLTVEQEADHIKKIQGSHDEIMLLAKVNGKIVGDASLSRLPRRMSHRGDLGIAVIKEYQNMGIGSLLLKEIICFAKENLFKIIELQVRSDNFPAIHLYEKFKFKKFGVHPSFFKINGEEIEFDYMYLSI